LLEHGFTSSAKPIDHHIENQMIDDRLSETENDCHAFVWRHRLDAAKAGKGNSLPCRHLYISIHVAVAAPPVRDSFVHTVRDLSLLLPHGCIPVALLRDSLAFIC
jgi:hypothetical protein